MSVTSVPTVQVLGPVYVHMMMRITSLFFFFLARMVEELDQGKNEWIHLETAVAS